MHPGGGAAALHEGMICADTPGMANFAVYVPERRRIVIHGQVQGVGFRLWLKNVAQSLNLVGSCRLLEDETCETIVQGDRSLVKQFVVACKRGPSEAQIERIEQEPMPVDPKLAFFYVEY